MAPKSKNPKIKIDKNVCHRRKPIIKGYLHDQKQTTSYVMSYVETN